MAGLTKQQLDTFEQEGMLCLPDFLSPDEVSLLMDRSHQLLDQFDVATHPKTQFKTDADNHIGDQYFFDSADKVSFFFDTDAFDDKGNLKYLKQQAINKIGHGLHMKEEVFNKITFDEKVKAIAKSLDYKDPRVLQSMLIFKQPIDTKNAGVRENSVPSHTDAAFLYTQPQSAVGFWYALEDCTAENGCLSYNPGSHKVFPLTKRFVKVEKGAKGCNFIPVEYDKTKEIPADNPDDYKLVECKAGSLILINNSVLHKSESNRSPKSRFAYAFHVIDGVAQYDALNWLQVPPGPDGGTEFSQLY